MADDIDIEEHDVLDNPVIRNLFPDITVIKKEISQYFEDVPDIKQEPEATTEKVFVKAVVPANTSPGKNARHNHGQSSSKNHTLKVLVGEPGNNYENREPPFHSTKIILGSKPNKTVENIQERNISVNKEPNISLKSVVRIPKVILQDLGEYIYESNRYCKDCKTLFSSKFDFQDHKLKSHSIKSRSKPTIVKVTLKGDVVEKTNKCNVCGSCFKYKSSLIRHLKNVHNKVTTTNSNHTKNKSHITSTDDQYSLNSGTKNETALTTRNKHLNVKVSLEEKKPDKKEKANINKKLVKRNILSSKSKCIICGSYFSSRGNLNRHYKNIHKKKISYKGEYRNNRFNNRSNRSVNKAIRSQKKNVKANSKNICFHCNKHFFDQNSLIEHIYTILESKQYNNSIEQKNKLKESKNITLPDTNVEGIMRIKDKLIFENHDSDESDCSLPETENLKKYNHGERINSKKTQMVSSLENEQSESVTDYEKQNIVRFSRKLLRNKSKHNLNDDLNFTERNVLSIDNEKLHNVSSSFLKKLNPVTKTNKRKPDLSYDTNSMECSVSDTGEAKKNQKLPESSSLAKKLKRTNKENHDLSDNNENSMGCSSMNTDEEINKNQSPFEFKLYDNQRKRDTKHKNTSGSIIENSNKKIKVDMRNKSRTLKINFKKEKPRNFNSLRFTPISKTYIGNNSSIKGNFVYECIYCSYIASSARGYCMHLFGKHKREKVSKVNKVLFDRQCKYCPARTSIKSHNSHLRRRHFEILTKPHYEQDGKEDVTKLKLPAFEKSKSFVLKSIIFKCTKCDIHFLSSYVARDHGKHMELLINWKCPICKKIFKKNDEQLHLKQHDFSETINVYQFNNSELWRLLYNCTKCAIHFTEDRYLKHYSNCGQQTTDSVYCKSCDILIDKCEYITHEDYHKTKTNTADIIVITGDLITKNEVVSTSQENVSNLKMLHSLEKSDCSDDSSRRDSREESNKESKSNQEELNNQKDSGIQKELSSQEEKKKSEIMKNLATVYSPMNCLTFCHTCKCYLSDVAVNRKSHVEGRCSEMVKYTCPKCGLVFTNKTINTHRTHHQRVQGLKLQDFEFFDLDGIQIRPPIPEYPSCKHCGVIFVGRNAVKGHICSETEHLTCEVCKVKLSENAFKLHMNFHSYCMPNEIVELLPRESKPKNIGLVSNVKILNHSCVAIAKTDKPQTIIQSEAQEHNIEVDKNPSSSNVMVSDSMLKIKSNNLLPVKTTDSATPIQNPNIRLVIESGDKDVKENNARKSIIMYTCQSCEISFDSYDTVIDHCQNHFSPNMRIPSSLKICPKCSLRFDVITYEAHQKLHLDCDVIQILTVDPIYFTSDNDTWIRHIFASVSPSIQKESVEKSIYQNESRIKMEVFQEGPSHLTVYKCNRCGIFIDHDCLIAHIRDSCPKSTGRYPCSVCGLPFMSYLSRTNHEKIHRLYDNVRLKSYKIVLVNCETHNTYNTNILNAMKQYIVYQCRTCDGIVDTLQRNNHICNVDDLQKCLVCGLLLYKDDFEKHTLRHSALAMYNTDHIKVVLFGNKNLSIPKTLFSTFKGLITDFKLYKCSKCGDCEHDKKLTLRHVCTLDDSKWKCPKCGNYISSRSIKQHIKMHDTDSEYKTDNFIIIGFGSDESKDTSSLKTADKHRLEYQPDSNATKLQKESTEKQVDDKLDNKVQNSNNDKESVVLYKCVCGLHYIDNVTAKNHVKICAPRLKIIRQNCSKCSLTFNPKELFSHILAHHSDKNKTFNYNVIEL